MQIIYLLGATASGKTTLSKKLSEHFGCQLLHADVVYDSIGAHYGRGGYRFLSPLSGIPIPDEYPDFLEVHCQQWDKVLGEVRRPCNTLIIEGGSPILDYEHQLINDYLNPDHCWYFHLKPVAYSDYFKKKFDQDTNHELLQVYNQLVEKSGLPIISLFNPDILLTPLPYQRKGLTDSKFQRFHIYSLAGSDVLDIGCNTGWFNDYCHDLGCESYTGVESSYRELVTAIHRDKYQSNFIFGKLQDVWDRLGTYDVIFLCATLHYFKDKEDIIKSLASLVSDTGYLLLETPINDSLLEIEMPYPNAGKDVTIPSGALVSTWLNRHFKRVYYVADSLPPDGTSHRLIYKAFKN